MGFTQPLAGPDIRREPERASGPPLQDRRAFSRGLTEARQRKADTGASSYVLRFRE